MADQIADAIIWKLATYYMTGAVVVLSILVTVMIVVAMISYIRDRLEIIDWLWLPVFLALIGAIILFLRALT